METFWFFLLRFRWAYDSAYDSDFRFSLGHKLTYDYDYNYDSDSVASEDQPLVNSPKKCWKMATFTIQLTLLPQRKNNIIITVPRAFTVLFLSIILYPAAHFSSISVEFYIAMTFKSVRCTCSWAKIPMSRPNEPNVLSKHTKRGTCIE